MRTYVLFDPITNQAYKEPGEEVAWRRSVSICDSPPRSKEVGAV
jgi:hypothetical protein